MDYGRRRIGLAVSDPLGLTARPLATLVRTNRRDDLRRLCRIARQHEVARVVVGHPVRLDGSASEITQEVARFAARLRKELGLPVELAEERLSSWEAEALLRSGPLARRKRKAGVDDVAAAVILRDYLARAAAEDPFAR